MVPGKLRTRRLAGGLFGLCWLAYVASYLGRLNYLACLVEIMGTEGWSKGQAGLVATSFFIAYGIGQLVNGFVGDRLSPRLMVAAGLGISGAVNLLFPLMGGLAGSVAVWGCNGFAQSMIWSPMIRLISEWLSPERRTWVCVNMNSPVPVGTLATYGISAALVYLGNWHLVFYVSGAVMLAMTVAWLWGVRYLETRVEPEEPAGPEGAREAREPLRAVRRPLWGLMVAGAIPLCMLAVLTQGMLKDGVTTWIPTILEEKFQMAAAGAILCTTAVPILNLGGVYFAAWLNARFFRNEVSSSVFLFGCTIVSILAMVLAPWHSAVFTLLMLSLATTFMMGVNALTVGLMPSYFVHHGVCSTMSGVLNSSVYAGCALSSYLNGALAERYGWNVIMSSWLCYAALGLLMCLLAARRWNGFRRTVAAME